MTRSTIHQFPCRQDNYGVLVHNAEAGFTASIDAPDAQAIENALAVRGWKLTHILITHHHIDHIEGVLPLKERTGCTVVGPRMEMKKIAGIDAPVEDGDTVQPGNSLEIQVIGTPGHTAGHVIYWMPGDAVVFVGDTLFAMGCGKVLEGTPETMWRSLQKIMALPIETSIYCGHEYTLANAQFALSVEPGNAALRERAAACAALREAGSPTLPTRLDLELATNPFLRPGSLEIRASLGLADAPAWKVFAELRGRKNRI